ncbi:styrene monooxygenase/indole monooxygenase family protein [Streptomyces cavernicola]|uniref:FAD-binding oxidoreductase n=1 Tax=Streptomyces cavernicola TaxID=3043613 RepID=A0ABT6S8X4_9ACTN|nr:styrene monooxygenase/indole monooxygenase family protein [Streptomyces sp. B-S-A6]MDI3404552.1 FAD-binding oxidoreductase [Streptomyces sp. B-S-A6]
MRKILIAGAGQSGLQLALGLQAQGYEVTLMSQRTADEIRAGRVMSTQVLFHTALQHERDLKLNFWESQAPDIEGLGVTVAAPGSHDPGPAHRAVDWLGPLDGIAQSVDQRVKTAGWLDTFAQRGGQLVIHSAAVSDLDYFSRLYDLVLVAAGKGELVHLFDRDPARSPYNRPQRSLAVSYVHGLGPRPDGPDTGQVRLNLVPGVGELVVMPALTTSGRADILFWEGVPGGPVDAFRGIADPAEHLALTLSLMERYTPWEYGRARAVELTDAGGTLAGRYTPTVRHPVATLPSGGLVLGVGDTLVANDPVTGQGANSAAKCAASYLGSILEHGDKPFDAEWMRSAFDRFWESVGRPTTRWTNAMLAPPPAHVLALITAAAEQPEIAHRFANGFDDPSDFEDYFYEPAHTERYLSSLR